MSNADSNYAVTGVERWLAEPIQQCGDARKLRKCAYEFARFAIEQSPITDEGLIKALALAEQYADGNASIADLEKARATVEELANGAEEQEELCKECEEDSLESMIAYHEAAAWSRACGAVLGALHHDARKAAAEAAYEARFTIGTRAEVTAAKQFHEFVLKLDAHS